MRAKKDPCLGRRGHSQQASPGKSGPGPVFSDVEFLGVYITKPVFERLGGGLCAGSRALGFRAFKGGTTVIRSALSHLIVPVKVGASSILQF